MALKNLIALSFALGTIEFAGAFPPKFVFKVYQPISVPGLPPVTLGPGSYVLRGVETSGRTSVFQIVSEHQDYVYTTVLTIPAVRPNGDNKAQFLFSEGRSATPATLHYWFPPGETMGQEFITPAGYANLERGVAPKQLQSRADGGQSRGGPNAVSPADYYALKDVMMRIESGKFTAARDRFRRNYFLAQSAEGASTSFLLALLMTDLQEARKSLELVRHFDHERMRTMSRLGVADVVESLPAARSNLKTSQLRRFLLNFALERTDDDVARSAILAFERHTLGGDSFPVEMALDRRRVERQKEKTHEAQWVLTSEQIARLSDCVRSLLNKVGALEYYASAEAKVGRTGSFRLRVILTQRRLNDLDAMVARSHRTICDRHAKLEVLISQRNAAISKELDALRSAVRDLDRQLGFKTAQFSSLRKWESAPASAVSRDLMTLAEAATSPKLRPSSMLRTYGGSVQIDIAASLVRLADWVGF